MEAKTLHRYYHLKANILLSVSLLLCRSLAPEDSHSPQGRESSLGPPKYSCWSYTYIFSSDFPNALQTLKRRKYAQYLEYLFLYSDATR